MFTVYVLYSAGFNKIYVGFTSDLQTRFLFHNQYAKKGWTKRFRPWLIIYSEDHFTKEKAMERERELKTARGRKFIWEKIKSG
jgi:putative endonuclease